MVKHQWNLVGMLPLALLSGVVLLLVVDQLKIWVSDVQPMSFVALIPVLLFAATTVKHQATSSLSSATLRGLAAVAIGMSIVVLQLVGATATALVSTGLASTVFLLGIAPLCLPSSRRSEVKSHADLSSSHRASLPWNQQSVRSISAEDIDEFATAANSETIQHWTRQRLSDGSEQLCGQVRSILAAGERVQHFHVPISPSFAAPPEVWCESDVDGVRVECTVRQPYGVRFTVRRSVSNCEFSCTAEIAIVLTANSAQRSAA